MAPSQFGPMLPRGTRAAALVGVVQAVLFSIGWYFMYHFTHEQVAQGLEEIIIQNNVRMARSITETLGSVEGNIEFGVGDWERAQKIIEKVELGSGGFACILDRRGNIVCHPQIRRHPELREINLSGHLFVRDGQDSEVELSKVSGDETASGTMRFLFDGKHYVATRLLNDNAVRLIVHQPVSGLTAASRHITKGLVVLAVVVGSCITGLTLLVVFLIARAYNTAMSRWNEELDSKVRERTEQLEQSLAEAQAAERAKAEFLANMSHEIRTPMNGVLGMVELLRDTPLSEDQEELVQTMRRSGGSLLTLLGDLLDFSLLSTSAAELRSDRFDAREVVQDCISTVLAQARTKGLSVQARIDDSVPARVVGDSGRLRQVLTNLIVNAVKFTDEGEVRVTVERHGPPTGELRLVFRVSDTGVGVAHGDQARIFEPFQQVDGSSTRRFGGVGLGLAISRELVSRMGGQIKMESELGKGSVMEVALPFGSCPEASHVDGVCGPLGAAGESSGTDSSPDLVLDGTQVLVVEDNVVNQLVTTRLLQKLGCEVSVASTGLKAVELLRQRSFSIVLMDCQMPVMDGYEATRRIRALPAPSSEIPIVALTAHALPGDVQKVRAAGMDDYLSKPVNIAQLRSRLIHWKERVAARKVTA